MFWVPFESTKKAGAVEININFHSKKENTNFLSTLSREYINLKQRSFFYTDTLKIFF